MRAARPYTARTPRWCSATRSSTWPGDSLRASPRRRRTRTTPTRACTCLRRPTATAPPVAGGGVELGYPLAIEDEDWDYRPPLTSGGQITFLVSGRRVVERRRSGSAFGVPAGTSIVIPAGGARDRWGNSNGQPLLIR